MDILKQLDNYSEELGTGIRKVYKYSKAYSGNEHIEFIEQDIFITNVPLDVIYNKTENNGEENGKLKNAEENYTENYTENTILLAINNNPKITIVELSRLIQITEIGIKWNIKKLKQKGLLQRIGSDKGGYWKVISKE